MKLTAKNNNAIKKRIKRSIIKYRGKYFGQNGEDIVILNLLKIIKPISKVKYLDIGSGDPRFLSNTYFLYKAGARGYCLDANNKVYKSYKRIRPNDIFLNYYIGPNDHNDIYFYTMDMKELSTASEETLSYLIANGFKIKKKEKMRQVSIATLFKNHLSNYNIDFVNIDVEGNEFDILQDVISCNISPSIICIEAVDFSTGYNSIEAIRIKKFMEDNGFRLYMNTLVNLIFIREDKFNECMGIYIEEDYIQ